MYISRFNICLTREYPQHHGTGSGVPQCAKNENRTCTRTTRFGDTVGLPAPMFNPILSMLPIILIAVGYKGHNVVSNFFFQLFL